MPLGHTYRQEQPYPGSKRRRRYVNGIPEGSYIMDSKRPYIELIAGIHNIFKIIHIQYVHRLNYNHLPTATKNGVRLMMRLTF